MDTTWKIIAGLLSTGLLVYLRWSDPKSVAGRKRERLKALKAKAKKLENIRDQLLAEHSTDGHTVQLGRVINRLAELRKEIRELEAD